MLSNQRSFLIAAFILFGISAQNVLAADARDGLKVMGVDFEDGRLCSLIKSLDDISKEKTMTADQFDRFIMRRLCGIPGRGEVRPNPQYIYLYDKETNFGYSVARKNLEERGIVLQNNNCSILEHGKEYVYGNYQQCVTCVPDQDKCKYSSICTNCIATCHKGHECSEPQFGMYFCDCGAGELGTDCQISAGNY